MQNGLVVGFVDANGNIDVGSVQPLNEWNNGSRSRELVRRGYGSELLEILTDELGVISYNTDTQKLISKLVVVEDIQYAETRTMQLLGKIAEALIVRECRHSFYANRRWASKARRGRNSHRILDNYIAVGTGLYSTSISIYKTKYSPMDTQRDIIWVHRVHLHRILSMRNNSGSNDAQPAGLQIKISRNGINYITPADIETARYEVPIVYFDLNLDFYKVVDNLRKSVRLDVDYELIRGSDLSFDIHDKLVSYYYLIKDTFLGHFDIHRMLEDNLVLSSIKYDDAEINNHSSIILPQGC